MPLNAISKLSLFHTSMFVIFLVSCSIPNEDLKSIVAAREINTKVEEIKVKPSQPLGRFLLRQHANNGQLLSFPKSCELINDLQLVKKVASNKQCSFPTQENFELTDLKSGKLKAEEMLGQFKQFLFLEFIFQSSNYLYELEFEEGEVDEIDVHTLSAKLAVNIRNQWHQNKLEKRFAPTFISEKMIEDVWEAYQDTLYSWLEEKKPLFVSQSFSLKRSNSIFHYYRIPQIVIKFGDAFEMGSPIIIGEGENCYSDSFTQESSTQIFIPYAGKNNYFKNLMDYRLRFKQGKKTNYSEFSTHMYKDFLIKNNPRYFRAEGELLLSQFLNSGSNSSYAVRVFTVPLVRYFGVESDETESEQSCTFDFIEESMKKNQ
ncbi:MAG: hypothetical protein AAFW83_11900 [Pseudomonadota bacterium]